MTADTLVLGWLNLDFGRKPSAHRTDLVSMSKIADVIGCCELRSDIEIPGFRRYSPNRLDGSAGSEALYIRDGIPVSRRHTKLEFLDRLAQRIGFRRINDVTIHHPAIGDVAVVCTHVPPARMARFLYAPSVARLQRRITRIKRRTPLWAAGADWNHPVVDDPAGLAAKFAAVWLGPVRGPHVSGIDGWALSPRLAASTHLETWNVPHPERTDGHPTVYVQLTAKGKR